MNFLHELHNTLLQFMMHRNEEKKRTTIVLKWGVIWVSGSRAFREVVNKNFSPLFLPSHSSWRGWFIVSGEKKKWDTYKYLFSYSWLMGLRARITWNYVMILGELNYVPDSDHSILSNYSCSILEWVSSIIIYSSAYTLTWELMCENTFFYSQNFSYENI